MNVAVLQCAIIANDEQAGLDWTDSIKNAAQVSRVSVFIDGEPQGLPSAPQGAFLRPAATSDAEATAARTSARCLAPVQHSHWPTRSWAVKADGAIWQRSFRPLAGSWSLVQIHHQCTILVVSPTAVLSQYEITASSKVLR